MACANLFFLFARQHRITGSARPLPPPKRPQSSPEAAPRMTLKRFQATKSLCSKSNIRCQYSHDKSTVTLIRKSNIRWAVPTPFFKFFEQHQIIKFAANHKEVNISGAQKVQVWKGANPEIGRIAREGATFFENVINSKIHLLKRFSNQKMHYPQS